MYVDQVWGVWPKAELWINGGFVTLKPWAAPKDVDVAIVDTFGRIEKYRDGAASLLTLHNVSSASLSGPAPRVQPYGGMVDGFAVPRLPANLRFWDDQWSTLCDKAKVPVPGFRKGYVKVVKPA